MDNKEDYIKRRMLEEQLDDNKKKLKKLERLEELSNKEQYRSHRLKEQLYHIFGRDYAILLESFPNEVLNELKTIKEQENIKLKKK